MSVIYHQSCLKCKGILTIEEMELHLKDLKGFCIKCRKDNELSEKPMDVQVSDN